MTSREQVRVDVLGPIRARGADGRDLTPDGVLQRRLLALLVLRRGEVVTADAAIEALWPSARPKDPSGALQNHLSRLRRGLPDGLIESVGTGYRLDPNGVVLDSERLAEAVRAAAAGGPVTSELDDLLRGWTGPAYPELDDLDDGRADATRLDELRSRAGEVRAAARLAAGDTEGLVAELAALVDAEPLRERPRSLLMSALAAGGRAAEALRVYDDFRRVLGDELGIEPSPALVAQHADLLAGAAPSAWRPASRLPIPATSLLGREALVAEVLGALEHQRMLTLVGPGGVGKTRVLIEVGHRLAADRPERPIVLCELTAADGTSAVEVVAAALGIDARPGVAPTTRVVDVLGATEVVVLLDNCEHVLEPVAELVEGALSACPNLVVVATSQERLRVPGEQSWRVPALPTDADDTGFALFVERARSVAPDFEPSAEERAGISDIVRRLDGLPLAIELAAARLHTLEVAEVADGLDRRFSLLSTGNRTSTRHGSLAAAVSWSVGLLDPPLQDLLCDLSVFTGSFLSADAAAVCDDRSGPVVEGLTTLVERSLVMRAPGRRYVLLETLRAFGAEELARTGRADLVRTRHAHRQVDWIEDAVRRMAEPGEPVLAAIDAAIPELRAAVTWLLDRGDIDRAGRLVTGLLPYGFLRLRPDVLAWAERLVELDADDRGSHAAETWVVAAYASWMAGDVATSADRSRRAMRLAEASPRPVPAWVLSSLASAELFEGHLDEAARLYRAAVDAAVATADPVPAMMASGSELLALGYGADPAVPARVAAVLDVVGDAVTPQAAYAWYCIGEAELSTDVELARTRFARALELAEQTNASFVTGVAGTSKASIDARDGDPLEAAVEYRRLIDHWRRAGMWSTQWTMLRAIVGLLARLGRFRDAAVLEGAIRSTAAGHRIFGADEVVLAEIGARLRVELGDDAYDAARGEGAVLDGDAAVDHALRSL